MWHKLGSVENFIEALFSADQQLAEHGRKQGCRGCGGRLHRADYPRKVRGVPDAYEQMFSWRFSFLLRRAGLSKAPDSTISSVPRSAFICRRRCGGMLCWLDGP